MKYIFQNRLPSTMLENSIIEYLINKEVTTYYHYGVPLVQHDVDLNELK